MPRNYVEKQKQFKDYTITYFYSKGESRKLLLAFPQGFQDAEHFKKHWEDRIPDKLNVIVIDPLGRGKSSTSFEINDYFLALEAYREIIAENGFEPDNTILFGKSFSTPTIELMLRESDDYLAAVLITGPRLFTDLQYHGIRLASKLALSSSIFRNIAQVAVRLTAFITQIDFTYYNWKQKNGWLQWQIPLFVRRFKSEDNVKVRFSTPGYLIFNRKDEIIPEKLIQQSIDLFENPSFKMIEHYTHWGETPEYMYSEVWQILEKIIED